MPLFGTNSKVMEMLPVDNFTVSIFHNQSSCKFNYLSLTSVITFFKLCKMWQFKRLYVPIILDIFKSLFFPFFSLVYDIYDASFVL